MLKTLLCTLIFILPVTSVFGGDEPTKEAVEQKSKVLLGMSVEERDLFVLKTRGAVKDKLKELGFVLTEFDIAIPSENYGKPRDTSSQLMRKMNQDYFTEIKERSELAERLNTVPLEDFAKKTSEAQEAARRIAWESGILIVKIGLVLQGHPERSTVKDFVGPLKQFPDCARSACECFSKLIQ